MSAPSLRLPPSRLVHGTAAVLCAEALALPTGLVTAGVLTRALGPNDYGLLTLTATVVSWVQWTITSGLARPTIRFVSQAGDPHGVARSVVRLHGIFGVAGFVLMVVLAGPVARVMSEPALAAYLQLFALDILVFALAQAHRNVLIGLGRFTHRAWASAGRWIARLVLIVALVHAGFGVAGAIWGSIGASFVELTIAQWYARPGARVRVPIPARLWLGYAAPLGLAAVLLRLFEKVDIVLLKGLGATAADTGIYGAAQNLSVVPGLFALSFSPLILSSIGRARVAGDEEGALGSARLALRVTVALAPFVTLAIACAPELVAFVFGSSFAAAAPILAILLGSALALLVISVTTAILIALDRPLWVTLLTVPLLPVAVTAHLHVIPRFGPTGAAAVTAFTASVMAVGALFVLHSTWAVLPGAATWIRAAVASFIIAAAAGAVPVQGAMVLPKLAILSALVVIVYLVLGELTRAERAYLRGAWSSSAGVRPPPVRHDD